MPPARGFLLAHYPQRPGSLASCADPHRLRFDNLQQHDLLFRLPGPCLAMPVCFSTPPKFRIARTIPVQFDKGKRMCYLFAGNWRLPGSQRGCAGDVTGSQSKMRSEHAR